MDSYTEQLADLETAQKLGLSEEEYERMLDFMGRPVNFTELSMYSVMWSEHCSYKNSIRWLKTLPREGGRLLVGAGEENAGLVDIGDGLACAFKIESHNHPSAIEPYQGAATGVGGIHRDIFTMGARPIAALNSLRFGDLSRHHTKHLLRGVVRGIGDYGNCFGVPTVGGETFFHPCYNQNILVNAMSVGLVKVGETVSACADGPGNPVFIVGSRTGKDGIHGATFASADLTEDSAEDLPSVQVGDPFQEKLLLEASLEAIRTGAVVGMQDMGAAGITCSTSEMSAKSGTGMRIQLDEVPTRQENMKPFEMLLSESQERMLVVVEKGREEEVLKVFEKWDLECAQIGEVTDTGILEFFHQGIKVAEVPADSLVLGGGAPVYEREYSEPAYLKKIEAFDESQIPEPQDLTAVARRLAASPNLVSRRWIYEQYDSMVRTNTVAQQDPSDAAIVRIKGTDKALAMTTDCNPAYVFADPYAGAMMAVAEAARNLACTGAEPLAVTNCLNFGNPYNPEVYWQFVRAVQGMGDACRKFNTPVTGGNVSFYNQTQTGDRTEPVYPTPTIGMIGLLENVEERLGLRFQAEGDLLYLLGGHAREMGSSEYLRYFHKVEYSPAPYFDLEEAHRLVRGLLELNAAHLLRSAHDLSEGGLWQALLESAIASGMGFDVEIEAAAEGGRKDCMLFGESQNRVLVSVSPEQKDAFEQKTIELGIPFASLGKTGGQSLQISGEDFGALSDWRANYMETLERIIESEPDYFDEAE